MPWTTQQIADLVGGRIAGDPGLVVQGLGTMDDAEPGELTYVGTGEYGRKWPKCRASAALVAAGLTLEPGPGRCLIFVEHVDLAVARLLQELAPPLVQPDLGVHPTAIVDPTAQVPADARIGAFCVIGKRVRLGDGIVLHPRVTVHDDVTIGAGTVLWTGAVVRERCTLGDRCLVHPNATIGADGFGFRPSPDGKSLVKIPQIGTVQIGNDVEIGANTCIDRGKMGPTVIGDGCKIDNLVQIAHNCVLGRNVIIAGMTGMGGSVVVGDGVVMGAQAGIKDHIHIGARAVIAAKAGVHTDVPPGITFLGYAAKDVRIARREMACMRYLPDLVRAFKKSRDGADETEE